MAQKNISQFVPDAHQEITKLIDEIQKAVIGQTDIIKKLIISLLAGGHVLLEGVPGLGKTLMVKALAQALTGNFGRIQFTPDLMPSDVTGHTLYDMQTGQWKTRKGAVFCHLLLADEINRAPAKTQSALLEAMQEGQVTIEGQTHVLPKPFICVATQNPVEQEGTYPLPEAQLDRFLMNLFMDYPTAEEEKRLLSELIVGRVGDKLDLSKVNPVMSPERLAQLQLITAHITVDDRVVQYALDIVRKSREFSGIDMGAGVRAGMALLRAAKACALMNNRDYTVPDDVRYVAKDVLRHRISLTADFTIDGYQINQVIEQLLSAINAPRS
ncbi:MAG: MoxR family ATPase [Moraxella sp.]|jgi:ATPase, AAA family|nr:MAG: MoxR family ATPase [Moraxella sp.]